MIEIVEPKITYSLPERLIAWSLEVSVQVLAFVIMLLCLHPADRLPDFFDIVVGCLAVSYIFVLSGYIGTFFILRVLFRTLNNWPSAFILTQLFLLHFEVLNRLILPSGLGEPKDRFVLRIGGVCIAFCTSLIVPKAIELWRQSKVRRNEVPTIRPL